MLGVRRARAVASPWRVGGVRWMVSNERGVAQGSWLPSPPGELETGQQRRVSWRSPTRDVNFSQPRWTLHRESWRHMRHLWQTPKSSVFRRLAYPDLALILGSSSLLTLYNEFLAGAGKGFSWLWDGAVLSLPMAPLTLPAMALGLLVTFRTNASYTRYKEARIAWGQVNNTSRDLVRTMMTMRGNLIRMGVDPSVATAAGTETVEDTATCASMREALDAGVAATAGPSETIRVLDDLDPTSREVVRLVLAFSIVLKFHVTREGGYHEDMAESIPPQAAEQRRQARLLGELGRVFDSRCEAGLAMAESIVAAPHRPLFVLTRLSAVLEATPELAAPAMRDETTRGVRQLQVNRLASQMEEHLRRLTGSLGTCERIVTTPIPTSFTRHASRTVTLWCHTAPFVLFPITGLWTPLAAAWIAWLFLGIEDIGVQIEEPFDVLPLWNYTAAIQEGCKAIVAASTKQQGL